MKKTLDEIKAEIARECAEEHFDVLLQAEILVGDYAQAKRLLDDATNRYIAQFVKEKLQQTELEVYHKAKEIVASTLSWEEKYDKIFSEEISQQFSFEYYDPDTSYQEDVMAFMNALDEYMKKQQTT